MARIMGLETKHQTSKKVLNPHLTGSTGIENKREEEWSPRSFDPTHHGTNDGWIKSDTTLRSKLTRRAPRLCI